MSATGMVAQASVKKEISNDGKKHSIDKLPIYPLAIGLSKAISQDKKLTDLSEKLQNIDEKTIRDFAKNINGIGHGEIVTDEFINHAIKGLKFDGDTIPNIANNDKNFTKIDDEIKSSTQKMMSLNSALLVVHPDLILKNAEENMVGLPIPVLASQAEEIGNLFKNDTEFALKSKALLPKNAQDIFDKNYPILKQKTVDEVCNQNLNIANTNTEDTQKISQDIVDNISNIYQMVTLRFLAQLGSPVIPENKPVATPAHKPAAPAA